MNARFSELHHTTFEIDHELCLRYTFMKLEDFLDHAKKHPGQLSYGSSGIGSSNYFTTYLFMAKCGIKMNRVLFPGAGQTMTALLGGHIDCFISTPGTAAAHIKPGGELRVLTFFTQKRWPELPDVPTFVEKGYDLERTLATGGGIAIGPVLLGAAKPVHILTPSATVRRIVNMTALTVADANAQR